MIDARILVQSGNWVKQRMNNLDNVKGITQEKKAQYLALFNASLFLLNWINAYTKTGFEPFPTGGAEKYFGKENYQGTCAWLTNYYTSIANIADSDLKNPNNKQKEDDEQTMVIAIAFVRMTEFFRRNAQH
jgi:hypothetical protein